MISNQNRQRNGVTFLQRSKKLYAAHSDKRRKQNLLQYEEDHRKHTWASKPNIPKYGYVFNGKFSVSVDGSSKHWDYKSYVLEDRLGDLLIQIYEVAETQRFKREEAERKKQEALEQRYDEEIDRTNALLNESQDYERTLMIRSYISSVEQKGSLPDDELAWISWAKQNADWYDPTICREDEVFGRRKHYESADYKEPKKHHPLSLISHCVLCDALSLMKNNLPVFVIYFPHNSFQNSFLFVKNRTKLDTKIRCCPDCGCA